MRTRAKHRATYIKQAFATIVYCVAIYVAIASSAYAAQVDIYGPAGGGGFGYQVKVLPNGNFVVVGPSFSDANISAVHLYSPTGTLISSLSGTSTSDKVGTGGSVTGASGVVVLSTGNFVVVSPVWNNGAGAVTWVNGTTGLSGTVSASNSLVGTTANDGVGAYGVVLLSQGNYLVHSPYWQSGLGAVTWGDGTTGVSGPVSVSNSLVGTIAGDQVGGHRITALTNGNFVVVSRVGATWGNGNTGLAGPISTSNSLQSGSASRVTALTNGNYVVLGAWNDVATATWANGATGLSGSISASNSLVGATGAGIADEPVVALSNGNYVVVSPLWDNGTATQAGAVTWANGSTGLSGTIAADNSLVGTTAGDGVGGTRVSALSNGNYVVTSSLWNNGTASAHFGAVTFADGKSGLSGAVSPTNSLIGAHENDFAGYSGVTALTNGNYVVGSPYWQGGGYGLVGAATWGNGDSGTVGTISASNSLVGTKGGDFVGNSIIALSNGNYVVVSSQWSNGAAAKAGAVTWANGATGLVGVVSTSNSLVGTSANDQVGYYQPNPGVGYHPGVVALSNGNYVVASPYWNNGAQTQAGAVTWASGSMGMSGPVSVQNSLFGQWAGYNVGSGGSFAFSDGNYVVSSPNWGSLQGAVTLASDRFRIVGPLQTWNSVHSWTIGASLSWDYDPTRHRLVVGRPDDNIVTLFTMDQIFADPFE